MAAITDRFGEGEARFRTRLDVLFARDGESAVVLRRGPRLHHRLIRWNLRDDTFTPGQWLKGTARLFDLTPAGDRLLYWARQWHLSAPRHAEDEEGERGWLGPPLTPRRPRGAPIPERITAGELRRAAWRPRRNEGVWTAVSTPPYFTAFAIWPSFGHWTGGGFFDGAHTIMLQEDARGLVPKLNARLPDDLVITTAPPVASTVRRHGMAHLPTYADRRGHAFDELTAVFQRQGVRWVEWFFVAGADLLFAADGQLFRLRNHHKVAPERVLEAARPLIDLRPMRFELIAAPPEALDWRSLRERGQRPRRKR